MASEKYVIVMMRLPIELHESNAIKKVFVSDLKRKFV